MARLHNMIYQTKCSLPAVCDAPVDTEQVLVQGHLYKLLN